MTSTETDAMNDQKNASPERALKFSNCTQRQALLWSEEETA
jgi:hypothetical protein